MITHLLDDAKVEMSVTQYYIIYLGPHTVAVQANLE